MMQSTNTLFALSLASTLAVSAPAAAQSYGSFAMGRTDSHTTALSLRWHSAPQPAGWSWAAALWATDRGAGWIGGGVSYTLRPTDGAFFLRGSLMPGLYASGNDRNLGGALEFATGIEIGTDLRNGAQLSLLLEHRSNAGIYRVNPGLDTLSVVYSLPLN